MGRELDMKMYQREYSGQRIRHEDVPHRVCRDVVDSLYNHTLQRF